MTEPAGAKNIYLCDHCGYEIVTVNVDEGTTPMLIACQVKTGSPEVRCHGTMCSVWYRVSQDTRPTHEWYQPSPKWARRKGEAMLDHVRRGGLVLREIEE